MARRRTAITLICSVLNDPILVTFRATKEIVLAEEATTAEACRRIAVSELTHYCWRREYGGLKTDQVRRMKDLKKENTRLRRAISDLTLDKLILQEGRCLEGALLLGITGTLRRKAR